MKGHGMYLCVMGVPWGEGVEIYISVPSISRPVWALLKVI